MPIEISRPTGFGGQLIRIEIEDRFESNLEALNALIDDLMDQKINQ